MVGKWTNRGKKLVLGNVFRAEALSGSALKLVLCTAAATPTVDTNTFSELTEIAAGNGYTAGGIAVALNSTDFPTLTEDDTNDLAYVTMKSQTWTAGGGSLPASGSGARWVVLIDANATPGSRQVLAFWDLGADTTVTVGGTITFPDLTLTIQEC